MIDDAGSERSDILDRLGDIVFESDRRGRLTYVSGAWTELTGLPVTEASAAWPDMLDDAGRDASRQFLTGSTAAAPIRLRLVRPHFGERWVELRGRARSGAAGSARGMVGVMRDVTEQVRQLSALEAANERFSAVADAATIGIYRADPDGRVTYINSAWPAKVGMTVKDALGHGWQRAVADTAPYAADPPWQGFTPDKPNKTRIGSFRSADGSVLKMEIINKADFDVSGQLTGFTGVMIDVTEQQRAIRDLGKLREREARLAQLAEHSSDAIFRISLDGVCLYASPSCKQVLGISATAVEGFPLLQNFHPEDGVKSLAVFDELASGSLDQTVIDYRSRSVLEPKTYLWLEANCHLIRDEAGLPREIVASVRDVGERKALEREVRRARTAADAASEAKSAFLANMSHEIRTPMNGVIGYTELLLTSVLDPEQRQQVERIAQSGQHMIALLNDVLDMSKIEAGETAISQETLEFGPLIEGAVELLRPSLQGKPVEMLVALDPTLPRCIVGDPARLRQIIVNLTGNAVKFTARGQISVTASREGAWLAIVVQDTGIGIAADRHQHVFDRFTQADASIHSRYGGTGLGLAISKGLAELMGGSLVLDSVEGKGSTFTLRVPLVAVATERSSERPARAETGSLDCSDRGTILVAEDNRTNQEVISAMLRKLDYPFEIVGTGSAALAKISGGGPGDYSLVLMDVQMPELDGISATRRLRELGLDAATLPIVALTAHSFEADIKRCLAAGMQGVLAKPIHLAELAETLERFLHPSIERPQGIDQSFE